MSKKLIAVALVALMLLVLPASAAIQATSVEIRGAIANETDSSGRGYLNLTAGDVSWGPQNFAAFYYNIKDDLGQEEITVKSGISKTIEKDELTYTTRGDAKFLKVVNKQFSANITAAKNAGLEEFDAGDMSAIGGKYKIVGWQAMSYVALKNKTNKLVKLILEQGSATADKKTLTVGETWDIGGGWTLSAQSIDAKATPRQVWIVLSKDGVKKDDKVIPQGEIYTYVESSFGGETDVPLFVTYVDSVFAGATTDMVQLRYTWVVDSSVTEVKSGDDYGSLRVKTANENLIQLNNSESTISLTKDSTVDIMGDVKFKVADSTTLRFYPMVVRKSVGKHEVRGAVANETDSSGRGYLNLTAGDVSWGPQNFAAFYYDIKDDLGQEEITVKSGISKTIEKDELTYTTRGDAKFLKVVDKQFSANITAAKNAGLEEFDAGDMSAIDGKYKIVGWQAMPYVALKNKTNKLVKLILEQGSATADKKTLTVGETWDIGGGWTLSAQSIDAKATPRQVWIVLSKDGVKKDDKVIPQGEIYTYVESSFGGETDVPLFVTYVDSVFAGATTDMVQLRYTWVVDSSVTEVKTGDDYGSLRVKTADENLIQLNNSESTISLTQDSTVDIMGDVKFKVADSTTLRFYPMVEYQISGDGDITPTPTTTATATSTAVGETPAGETPAGETPASETPAGETPASETPAPEPTKTPGFEAVFAIAGLLAVAFLVLRQRK